MVLFGIDPGTAATGYGVISAVNNTISWVDSGVIRTRGDANLAEKLVEIYEKVRAGILKHCPDRVCVEQAFYGKNVHTTLLLGHARGVVLLAAKQANVEIVEYSPREIKKAVVGKGNAQKDQVAYMIKTLVSPPTEHTASDAYDALAAALCGYFNYNSMKIRGIK
ncbi:MAG: crossover junction endodeoxyribonuclease RuvC [Chitinivibrionales bacterium]|nr:crossover junction endodeoxyribonuclease RuvC [Chitinivibrionales bacterium]